jgi:hypothetical protein
MDFKQRGVIQTLREVQHIIRKPYIHSWQNRKGFNIKSRLLLIFTLSFITLTGCKKDDTPQQEPPKPALRPIARLNEQFGRSDSVVFKSWNGELPQGADCRTDIILRADGSASLLEYGYALQEYKGSYSITNANEVVLALEGYPEWPTMVLAEDKSSLILQNKNGSTAFIFGKRSASSIWGDPNKFWPFRMESLDKKQESQKEH